MRLYWYVFWLGLVVILMAACAAAPRVLESGLPAIDATPGKPTPTAAVPVVSAPTPVTASTGSSPAIAFKPAGEIEGLIIEKSDGNLWLKVFSQPGISVDNPHYWVAGEALAGTLVSVNDSTYQTGPDQRFSIYVGLDDGPNSIVIVARNARGQQVTIQVLAVYNQAP